MKYLFIYIATFLALIYFSSCQTKALEVSEPIIAQVFEKKLLLSDLDKVIANSLSPQDSAQKTNAFINRWVRENLIMHEAETNLSEDLDLNQLVNDYKSSLILFHYEKKLIQEKMDTTVSEAKIREYFQNNAEEFIQAEPLTRVRFAIIPSNDPGLKLFKDAWKKNDEKNIIEFCSKHAAHSMLDTSIWMKISEIKQHYPPQGLKGKTFKKGRDFQFGQSGFEYFLKIEDFVDKNEIPPIAFIKDQIIKIILHRRKTEILHEFENTLLEKETNNNNVKIFTK